VSGSGIESVIVNAGAGCETGMLEEGVLGHVPNVPLEPLTFEHWFAVSVRLRYERLVSRHLEQRGVNYLLPIYRSMRRWKDRRKQVETALFPGYIFVNIDSGMRSSVLTAPGVLRFVMFQGQPAPVADSDVRALEKSMTTGLGAQPHPYLRDGRRVRVKSGPLVGAEGIVIRRKERFRLVLSIDLIMRSVVVEVDESDVEPL
jgi:transcription antitermination factor NusG